MKSEEVKTSSMSKTRNRAEAPTLATSINMMLAVLPRKMREGKGRKPSKKEKNREERKKTAPTLLSQSSIEKTLKTPPKSMRTTK